MPIYEQYLVKAQTFIKYLTIFFSPNTIRQTELNELLIIWFHEFPIPTFTKNLNQSE